ncbi:PPOX class F420-dependent oxidoreductase [Nocardioides sp. AN3]
MSVLPPSARELIEQGRLAHLVTINRDGSPQVSCAWVGLDGSELVLGHNGLYAKVRNMMRDPRVALSLEGTRFHKGVQEYLVIHGKARVTEGGGAEVVNRLAETYGGVDRAHAVPRTPGFVTHIEVERIGGVGPWAPKDSVGAKLVPRATEV